MFEGAKKRRLEQAVLNVSNNLIYIYKQGVKSVINQLNDANSEEEYARIYAPILKQYFDAVNNTVLEGMDVNTKTRVRLYIMKDHDHPDGIYRGGTFAGAVWWALENQELDSYTMSKINHLQNDILERALMELSRELG